MTIPATPKQQRVLDFIRSYFARFHRSPSFYEIRMNAGVRSLATVYKIVGALESRGWIRQTEGHKRSIMLIAGKCPACGQKIKENSDGGKVEEA